MTNKEAMQMALDALVSFTTGTNGLYEGEFAEEIEALRAALAQNNSDTVKIPTSVEEAIAMQRVSYAYLKQHAPEMLAQGEQEPIYRRGSRLICLETGEHCVIQVAGTGRQWVKFPDSHIGVYTNAQVAGLFELTPSEFNPDWDAMAVMVEEQQRMAKRIEELEETLARSEQKPVAFLANATRFKVTLTERGCKITDLPSFLGGRWVALVAAENDCHLKLTAPPQRSWQGLTEEEIEAMEVCLSQGIAEGLTRFARAIEAKLKEKNT